MKRDVVVFGEAIWDLFPRAPGESLRERRMEVRLPGGAPANVARTLARLGVDTSLVSALGDDGLGRAMEDELRACGVSTRHLLRVKARTAITFVDVASNGARSFLFYRHPSADQTLEAAQLRASWFSARWAHFGSSTLCRAPTREATLAALRHARGQRARISVDINARPHLWPRGADLRRALAPLLSAADLVKVSEDDLRALGWPPNEAGARKLHERRRRHDGITVLTLAERGAVGLWGELRCAHPARRARAVDATGAGDAFVAGALAVLVRHGEVEAGDRPALLKRMLEVGCTLGTRAITRIGSTTALKHLDGATKLIARPLRRT